MLSSRKGAEIEASFLRSLEDSDVRSPAGEDWRRIAELVRQYSDFPLGGVDASVITLAEKLGADAIVTLDRRHFESVRGKNGAPFRLLPE